MRKIQYHHEPGSLPPTLQGMPFLSGLDGATIDKILSEVELLECDPGDVIIGEGDDSKFFCILLKGSVDIVKGGNKITQVSHPGEVVGELALVTDKARSASVVAASHAFCLKVEPDFLGSMSDAERNGLYAKIYLFVTKILGERLESATRQVTRLKEEIRRLGGLPPAPDDGPATYRL